MVKKQKLLALALCALMLSMSALPVMAESTATEAPAAVAEVTAAEETADTETTATKVITSVRDGAGKAIAGARTVVRHVTKAVLTEEQQLAVEQAQTDKDAAYEAYLAKLAAAGILAQAELDAYHLMANYTQIASNIDTMQWTLAKNIELQEALTKSGAELRDAIAGFVAEGLLTELEGESIVAISTNSSDIDYDNLTIGQYKALQQAMAGTSEERAAALSDLVAQGLLTQIEADVLLSAKVNAVSRISTRSLTEEQRAAWKTAREELQADYTAIAEQLGKVLSGAAD